VSAASVRQDERADAAIDVRALHKSFGSNEVLRGIDFSVARGEVVCVIGPSGSGKSTLLRCINLLEEPTSGQVLVGGVDVTHPDVDIDAVRRRIGMVFQSFNLFPHLTVLENLTIAQRRVLRRSKGEAEQVARIIWHEINYVNLKENIEPTRERAHLILDKDGHHLVQRVRLRKL
jgi:polar amino acid transport system ATP-binding protein